MAPVLFLVPRSRSKSVSQRAPNLVPLAIEPGGDGPYVEAVREWIERVTAGSRNTTLRLVR